MNELMVALVRNFQTGMGGERLFSRIEQDPEFNREVMTEFFRQYPNASYFAKYLKRLVQRGMIDQARYLLQTKSPMISSFYLFESLVVELYRKSFDRLNREEKERLVELVLAIDDDELYDELFFEIPNEMEDLVYFQPGIMRHIEMLAKQRGMRGVEEKFNNLTMVGGDYVPFQYILPYFVFLHRDLGMELPNSMATYLEGVIDFGTGEEQKLLIDYILEYYYFMQDLIEQNRVLYRFFNLVFVENIPEQRFLSVLNQGFGDPGLNISQFLDMQKPRVRPGDLQLPIRIE